MAAAKKFISKEISSSNHEETINKSLEDFRNEKLLEIYSKGLYSSIDEDLCEEVLSLFESLDSKEHKEEMQNLFKQNNKQDRKT